MPQCSGSAVSHGLVNSEPARPHGVWGRGPSSRFRTHCWRKAPAVCPSRISSGQAQGHICIQRLMNMQVQSPALSPQLGTVAFRIPQSIPGGLCLSSPPHQGHSCTLILPSGEQPTPAHLPSLVKKIKIEKGIHLGQSPR